MRVLYTAIVTCFIMPGAMAKTLLKTETVEEQEKTEIKVFCSKNNEKEALNLCEKWLEKQSKSLGERLLTGSCSQGDQTADAACLYKATGDLKFVLKKYRTETERD